jgi:hypothetical protein
MLFMERLAMLVLIEYLREPWPRFALYAAS